MVGSMVPMQIIGSTQNTAMNRIMIKINPHPIPSTPLIISNIVLILSSNRRVGGSLDNAATAFHVDTTPYSPILLNLCWLVGNSLISISVLSSSQQ